MLALGMAVAAWAAELAAEPVLVDRTVVRFVAPEIGGASVPRFIFQRELAFEAHLEALADPDHRGSEPYRERHAVAALERHVAETLLSSLRIDPEPTAAQLVAQTEAARLMLVERIGGIAVLERAAAAEGIASRELRRLLRRRARASLYLQRMVAPMLEPSEAELRAIHRSVPTPFSGAPYSEVAAKLRRWYSAQRLSAAVIAYYQGARARLSIQLLSPLVGDHGRAGQGQP